MSRINNNIHPAALSPDELLRDCKIRTSRRSGPGGQHRNKVETAVIISHTPTGISAEASERRSQSQNRGVAIFRLRLNLALKERCTTETQNIPSTLWKSRCRNKRISVNAEHADFPALLAEALDRIVADRFDVSAAAISLECSTSQLVKLLKKEPRAFALVNEKRTELQLQRLK